MGLPSINKIDGMVGKCMRSGRCDKIPHRLRVVVSTNAETNFIQINFGGQIYGRDV